MPNLDADAAREYVREERGDVVDAVGACADAVADRWDGDSTAEADAITAPLEACLDESGVLDALPDVLSGAVEAAGGEMQASPVAAAPYVAVTSRGPVLRATLDGGRLVVTIAVFHVNGDGRYERLAGGASVSVAVK